MSFEEKMKQDLKKDLEIPEIVEQKIQDCLLYTSDAADD